MTETVSDSDRARTLHAEGVTLLLQAHAKAAVDKLRLAVAIAPDPDYLNDLAIAYVTAGQHNPAQAVLLQAVRDFPGDQPLRCSLAKLLTAQNRATQALQILAPISEDNMTAESRICRGLIFYKLGRCSHALSDFEAARAKMPKALPVRHMLAKCYNEEKRWTDALRVLEEAEKIAQTYHKPLSVQHFLMAGWAAMHAGDSARAVAAFQTVRKHAPDHDLATEMLGQIHAREFRSEAALALFEQLSARHPDAAHHHDNAAQMLVALQRYPQAIARLKRACRCDPDFFPAARHLCDALAIYGPRDAALAQMESLTRQFPQKADAWIAHGDGCLITGDTATAEADYRRALTLSPHNAGLYRRLMDLNPPLMTDDPLIAQMEAELDRPHDAQAQASLHLALAHGLDRLGRYDAAMRHLADGNRCMRRTLHYNETSYLNALQQIGEAYDAPLPPPLTAPDNGPQPLFIVGLPRSGTTLIEQILASHSAVFGAGERAVFDQLRRKIVPANPHSWPALPPETLHHLGTEYLRALRPLAPDARYIVDKMPSNGIYAGLICQALPGAKILWVERDLMDCCFSCYQQIFAGNLPYVYDQGELGRYARTFTQVMRRWETVLPDNRFLHFRYEDLLAAPEEKIRQLIAFCGLEWQESCLHFEKTARAVHTASAAQVRKPLQKNTGGRWKPYANALTTLSDIVRGR